MAEIEEHTKALTEHLMNTTEADTIARVQTRTTLIFEMFYDDEEGEPDQVIRDALTDLMHVAAERGVDFEAAVTEAARMWTMEREDWELND
ncbi:hypothetical protein SEA_ONEIAGILLIAN_83 [Microbacterium phage OneinaGillian]|uniref:Uncharacterized protein n=1 Tax=Microbacterium phage OneinaGillian TaxID=2301604 RepID=A0A385UHC1_9CAUD|nr:hypothetical protein HOU23_gp083 [Microbacterium phage OneinaGillian]AYB70193.1 hypothetical protein SEA_ONEIAGILLIAN_83 [Microbacterium phage OneinaGillian]QJD53307.1 hypothetical protein SEA_TEMPO_86 [Microbacterium phage Tempo]